MISYNILVLHPLHKSGLCYALYVAAAINSDLDFLDAICGIVNRASAFVYLTEGSAAKASLQGIAADYPLALLQTIILLLPTGK